jgi:hypothetical protein
MVWCWYLRSVQAIPVLVSCGRLHNSVAVFSNSSITRQLVIALSLFTFYNPVPVHLLRTTILQPKHMDSICFIFRTYDLQSNGWRFLSDLNSEAASFPSWAPTAHGLLESCFIPVLPTPEYRPLIEIKRISWWLCLSSGDAMMPFFDTWSPPLFEIRWISPR